METDFKNPDLHMHSVFSDGTDSPQKLIENVRSAGIDIFSLTDHDTAEGCTEVQKCLAEGDPQFIGGIEFSCADEVGKYHILGYGYGVNKSSFRDAVEFAHNIRMEKLKNRFVFLKERYGFTFTPEEEASVKSQSNPGKPHFVALMLKKGYIATKEEGFALFSGYRSSVELFSPEAAIGAILNADGIPVLAHGILADGSKNLTEAEIEQRVTRFKKAGLMGLECYYSGYSPEQKRIMLDLAEKQNLLITAGSDYHGTNKTVRLRETNNPDPARLKRFYTAVSYLL